MIDDTEITVKRQVIGNFKEVYSVWAVLVPKWSLTYQHRYAMLDWCYEQFGTMCYSGPTPDLRGWNHVRFGHGDNWLFSHRDDVTLFLLRWKE